MRCRTVGGIIALALTIFVAPLVAAAQKPAKIPRIGYLRGGSAADAARRVEALRQGLRNLGYIEGQNFTIESRTEENYDRLLELAAELVRLQVDVIVASSAPAIRAAKQATSTIPIVMAVGGPDPRAPGWLPAWRGQVATSRACLSELASDLPENGWSCSRKPCLRSRA